MKGMLRKAIDAMSARNERMGVKPIRAKPKKKKPKPKPKPTKNKNKPGPKITTSRAKAAAQKAVIRKRTEKRMKTKS